MQVRILLTHFAFPRGIMNAHWLLNPLLNIKTHHLIWKTLGNSCMHKNEAETRIQMTMLTMCSSVDNLAVQGTGGSTWRSCFSGAGRSGGQFWTNKDMFNYSAVIHIIMYRWVQGTGMGFTTSLKDIYINFSELEPSQELTVKNAHCPFL